MNYLYFTLATLIFTFFDLWLYPIFDKKDRLTFYRIIQTAFQAGIAFVLYQFGIPTMLAFLLFWWFGGCDVLFYFIGDLMGREGYKFWNANEWYWLAWTPVGIIQFIPNLIEQSEEYSFLSAWKRARGWVNLTSETVLAQAAVGLILAACSIAIQLIFQ